MRPDHLMLHTKAGPSSLLLGLLAIGCGCVTAAVVIGWLLGGLPTSYYVSVLVPGFLLGFLLRSAFRMTHLRDVRNGFLMTMWASFATLLLINGALQFAVVANAYHGMWMFKRYHDMDKSFPYIFSFLIPLFAWWVGKPQLRSAYCKSCGMWAGKPQGIFFAPNDFQQKLVDVVQTQNVEGAKAIVSETANLPLGQGSLVARLYRCPSCGWQIVDVMQYASTTPRSARAILVEPIPVSDEFVAALESPPRAT